MTAIEFNCQLLKLENKLLRYALGLTLNREDAKDLLQDTILKAISYRNQFVEYTSLKAWTYTIMKNTFINNYRKNIRQNTIFDNTKDLFFISQNKDTNNATPDCAYSANEISKIIEGLDESLKTPFKMHTEGYKYKEIAQKLDLKLGTVKSRIFFTRKKLMSILEDYSLNKTT